MSLAAGSKLGPYEILAPIAGGMREVYRARDSRLDRIITIKVSKEQFSDRFEREARAVAALNIRSSVTCTMFDRITCWNFAEGEAPSTDQILWCLLLGNVLVRNAYRV
jgi:hypothetical protein